MLSKCAGLWIVVAILITVVHASSRHKDAPVGSWGLKCRDGEMTGSVLGRAPITVATKSVAFWQRMNEIMGRWGFSPSATTSYECVRTGDVPKAWGLSVTVGSSPATPPGMVEEIESIRMTGDRTKKCFEWTASSFTWTFVLTPAEADRRPAPNLCTSGGRNGICTHSSRCSGDKATGVCAGSAQMQCCLAPVIDLDAELASEGDDAAQKQEAQASLTAQQQTEETAAETFERAQPAEPGLATERDAFVEETERVLGTNTHGQKSKGKHLARLKAHVSKKAESEETVRNPMVPELWPGGVVRWSWFKNATWQSGPDIENVPRRAPRGYSVLEAPDAEEQEMFIKAIDYWRNRTSCIRWEEVPINAPGHKLIVSGGRSGGRFCACNAGTWPSMRYQHLSFTAIHIDKVPCRQGLSLIHELAHAVGMLHTMQRADRAPYIRVQATGIQADQYATASWANINSTFEYGSSLDYPVWGRPRQMVFALQEPIAINESPNDGGMGQHILAEVAWVTDNDIAMTHRAYGCPPHLQCANPGVCPTAATLRASRVANGGNDCRPGWDAIRPVECKEYCQSYTRAGQDSQCAIPARRRPPGQMVYGERPVAWNYNQFAWSWPPDISSHDADTRFPDAWPCSVGGVHGRCMPTARCTAAGGQVRGGSCPGHAQVQCCHTGNNQAAATAVTAVGTAAVICHGQNSRGSRLQGTCIRAADCSTAKGAELTNSDCPATSPATTVCCRHRFFPTSCNSPRSSRCRRVWSAFP